MYTQDEFTEFGYVKTTDKKFQYSFDENIFYGRYCKSAIAAVDAASNKMTCVKIDNIYSNLDKTTP